MTYKSALGLIWKQYTGRVEVPVLCSVSSISILFSSSRFGSAQGSMGQCIGLVEVPNLCVGCGPSMTISVVPRRFVVSRANAADAVYSTMFDVSMIGTA